MPIGTTAERPSSPEAGEIRFNTDLDTFEGYDGFSWGSIGRGTESQNISFDDSAVLFTAADAQAAIEKASEAENTSYDSTTSGLSATTTQTAIDESILLKQYSGSGEIRTILASNVDTFTSTEAELTNVVRVVSGKVYRYQNVTFDYTTADTTETSGTNLKWRYVYGNEDGTAFYVSDTPPARGENHATIAGDVRAYICPIYATDETFRHFYASGNFIHPLTPEHRQWSSGDAKEGIRIFRDTGTRDTDTTIDISGFIPGTASAVFFELNSNTKVRNDSGQTWQVREFFSVKRVTDGSMRPLLQTSLISFVNTPLDGSFFPRMRQSQNRWIATDGLDFTEARFFKSGSDTIFTDGLSNISVGMLQFIDRSMF